LARKYVVREKKRRLEADQLLAFRRFAASIKIQRVYRGFRARRNAQKLRYEKLKWMHLSVLNRSALQIQSCWRGYHGRLASHLRLRAKRALVQEQHEAATRIQRGIRLHLARKEQRRRMQARAALQSQDRRRARSVIRIQKLYRGRRARKQAQEMRQQHQNAAKSALDRLIHQTKTRAAVKIQCCGRHYLARLKFLSRQREVRVQQQQAALIAKQHRAACVIQCALRRTKARRELQRRRHELEKRLSMMASEKAHDEIERLRKQQEEELAKLKMMLTLQQSAAESNAAKLRAQLQAEQEEETQRLEQELAASRLQALMLSTQQSEKRFQEVERAREAERLRQELEQARELQQKIEARMRTQENEDLAKLKMTSMLHSTAPKEDLVEQRLQQEATQLQRAANELQKEQASLQIQSFCLRHLAARRLRKLQKAQQEALASLHSEEERMRLKASHHKELALAKLKSLMDEDARERERELKQLEMEMIERARIEKERLVKRNHAARTIQARARGFLGRQRVKAIQNKIDKEREERAKSREAALAAAEAKVAEALADNGASSLLADGTATEEPSSPEDWVEYWDENAQASYFYNIRTQEASWTRPFSAGAEPTTQQDDSGTNLTGDTATAAVDHEPDYYGNYAPAVTTDAQGNGYSSAGYADEYGYYDQYGQYHYYEEQKQAAAMAAYAASQMMGYGNPMAMQMNPMFANYASPYAYQAMAAFANPMIYQNAAYNAQYMQPNTVMMANATPAATGAVVSTTEAVGDGVVPPDPWEKFFDQYTGAAYYYNNLTGERYWT
jgi:hypothetical protein